MSSHDDVVDGPIGSRNPPERKLYKEGFTDGHKNGLGKVANMCFNMLNTRPRKYDEETLTAVMTLLKDLKE